jgi:hypothetical protein
LDWNTKFVIPRFDSVGEEKRKKSGKRSLSGIYSFISLLGFVTLNYF